MESFDFSAIIGHVIEGLTVVIMVMITWAVKWLKSKTESDIMQTVMNRLEVTVKNGVRYAIHQGEESIKGKLRIDRPKNMVVSMAIEYVLENSLDLVVKSGYTKDKIRRMVESKLPQIMVEIDADDVLVRKSDLKMTPAIEKL